MKIREGSRKGKKLRLAIEGPSGSGKTYTALRLAHCLGKKVCVIDTENASSELYIGLAPDGIKWQFNICELANLSLEEHINAMRECTSKFDVTILDSATHVWNHTLDRKNKVQGSNEYTKWLHISPVFNEFMRTIVEAKNHVIVTLRSKSDIIITPYTDKKTGQQRNKIDKIGVKAMFKPEQEFEFDIMLQMYLDGNRAQVIKTRCSDINGMLVDKPGPEFCNKIIDWLNNDGESQPINSPPFINNVVPNNDENIAMIAVIEGVIKRAHVTSEQLTAAVYKRFKCSINELALNQLDSIKAGYEKLADKVSTAIDDIEVAHDVLVDLDPDFNPPSHEDMELMDLTALQIYHKEISDKIALLSSENEPASAPANNLTH